MSKTNKINLIIGTFLAFVGGFLDSYTYILHGKVFANAQTGNIVLMSISAVSGNFFNAFCYFIPIFSFFIGVFITEYLKQILNKSKFFNAQNIVILTEIIIFFIIGLLPKSIPDIIINVTISFICSLQVNCFRKLSDLPYATTMCTGNLRSASENLFFSIFKKQPKNTINFIEYMTIIFSFCIGAGIGSLLIKLYGIKTIWICALTLLIVLMINYKSIYKS